MSSWAPKNGRSTCCEGAVRRCPFGSVLSDGAGALRVVFRLNGVDRPTIQTGGILLGCTLVVRWTIEPTYTLVIASQCEEWTAQG